MTRDRSPVSMESLETRRLLSASLTAAGHLVVVGETGVPNSITVGFNADASSVDVSVNAGAVQSFDASQVNQLQIIAGDLGDTVVVDESLHAFTIKTRIFGGAGNDSIKAGGENDYITGGAGNDTIDAGAGKNVVSGGAGDDAITASGGDNRLGGGGGNDTISGNGTADTIMGGKGDDSLACGTGADLVMGGKGADTLVGGAGDATLLGGAGPDVLRGNGRDVMDGGRGTNDLTGDGNDTLAGVKAKDHVQSTGGDMISADPAPAPDVPPPPVHTEPANPPAAADLGVVTGIVTDSGGNPVASASVLLRTLEQSKGDSNANAPASPVGDGNPGGDTSSGKFSIASSFATTTDANGQFTLANVPVGDYVILAGKRGVGISHGDATVTKDQTTMLTLALQLADPAPVAGVGSVGGTVRDGGGTAVSGATVLLVSTDGSATGPAAGNGAGGDTGGEIKHPGGAMKTQTDANGAFAFSDVPDGQYVVVVFKQGQGDAHVGVSVTTGAAANADVTLAGQVAPPPVVGDVGTVSGVVQDGNGAPVANASVALLPSNPPAGGGDQGKGGGPNAAPPPTDPKHWTFDTDAQGHFTFANIPIGTYTLVAGKSDVGLAHVLNVVVTKDATTTETVMLTPVVQPPPVNGSGKVTGMLSAGDGSAVSGATVALLAPPTDPKKGFGRVIGSATSDDGGAFMFNNVPAGEYLLYAGKKGVGVAHVTVSVTADGSVDEMLTLAPPPPGTI